MTDFNGDTSDRLAILDLAFRYAAGVDRRDEGLFLSAFHPDASLTVVRVGPDGAEKLHLRTGHEELKAVPRLVTRHAKTYHFIGNHQCDVAGDVATGEVYCMAHHLDIGPERQSDYVMLIRYQDVYRRDSGGQWLIASRRVVTDWNVVNTVQTV